MDNNPEYSPQVLRLRRERRLSTNDSLSAIRNSSEKESQPIFWRKEDPWTLSFKRESVTVDVTLKGAGTIAFFALFQSVSKALIKN